MVTLKKKILLWLPMLLVMFACLAFPQGTAHNVTLTWTASTSSNIAGYNVYRGTISGGPYTKLTAAPITPLSYIDAAVTQGTEYFYVVTAVNTSNAESVFSSEANATIPTNPLPPSGLKAVAN